MFVGWDFSISGREKAIDYLVYEIRQKLSVRTAPEKGYVRRTTIKVPMDREVFEDLFNGVSGGRRRFDVTVEDLDILLPDGWSERAFRTSTKYVVCRGQPITIRFANQRKLHYDHSDCPRYQWSGDGEKPAALCQPRKTWPVDLSHLSLPLVEREVTKNRRRKVTIIKCITSSRILFYPSLIITISPSFNLYGF